MQNNPCRHLVIAPLLAIAAAIANPASAASIVFSDGTFNPADYVSTAGTQTPGALTVNVGVVSSGGNPGAAALTSFTYTPNSGVVDGWSFMMNTTWLYDPSISGALGSLSFSADRVVSGFVPFGSHNVVSIIEQGGNFYLFNPPSQPITPGVWFTTSASNVQASMYDLITNMTTQALDPTQHPNFSSGVMDFGFRAHVNYDTNGAPSAPNNSTTFLTDNVTYTLQPVPLPAAAWLLLSGLGGLGALVRKKRGTRLNLARTAADTGPRSRSRIEVVKAEVLRGAGAAGNGAHRKIVGECDRRGRG